MLLSAQARKLALTMHVVSSVGWLGAVAVFLALAITGLASEDAATVRAVYVAMDAIGWYVLVPFSFASLLTGLIQSLGSRWGLLQHYWVVAKLLINVAATIVLLLYTESLGTLAAMASAAELPAAGLDGLRSPSPLLHAIAGLSLLLAAAGLSVYKPAGRTRYGWRKQNELSSSPRPAPNR